MAGAFVPYMTVAPTPNWYPQFLGAGYDWSGVGWRIDMTYMGFAAVSPQHFAMALHNTWDFPSDSSGTRQVMFLGSNGTLTTATCQTRASVGGDATVGGFTTPLPKSAGVSYYPVISFGDASSPADAANFQGKQFLFYASNALIGTNTISSAYNSAGTYVYSYPSYSSSSPAGTAVATSGDSGSPSLFVYQGKLMLLGTHYTTRTDTYWGQPQVISAANLQMQSTGYAINTYVYATSNFTGGAGNGDFSNAANWVRNDLITHATPSNEGLQFDAANANGQYTLALSADQSLKGIVFKASGNSHGFTINGGRTLTLGMGGIHNEDAPTQVISNNIVLTEGQHWSANGGDLQVNGSVANGGYLLVVDGDHNSTINGAISGTGGLGKEGNGILTLTSASTYSGTTWVHNGNLRVTNSSGSATGSGQVIVEAAGTLSGTGAIAGPLQVQAGATLAPGHLTAQSGIAFQPNAHLSIRLSGGQSDQLIVTGGNVDITGTNLDIDDSTFSAGGGSVLWILNNTGSGTLTGQFSGLTASGDLFTGPGSHQFRIYYGADYQTGQLSGGNDIALVTVPEPAVLGVATGMAWLLLRRRPAMCR